jgi:hypothetical protein
MTGQNYWYDKLNKQQPIIQHFDQSKNINVHGNNWGKNQDSEGNEFLALNQLPIL